MICKRIVSEERQARSRKNYTKFVLINGFAFCCLGGTVIILLAVQLKAPDWVIAILGAMSYFGFLLLPLGRQLTSWKGAARSQHTFWVFRNIAALFVAASVPVCLYVSRVSAMIMMLTGAFFFYGFRAAGVVMSGPLINEITNEENRVAYISQNSAAGYALGVVALTIINILEYVTHNNLWTLTGVVIAGAFLGIHASSYLRKVDETRVLRDSCRKPVLPQLKELLQMPGIKRLLICTFYLNLSLIMLSPISLLTLKRGYHISDTVAVVFTILLWIAASVTPRFTGKLIEYFGPRKMLVAGGITILSIAFFWIILPFCYPDYKVPLYLLGIPFLIEGTCMVGMNTALTHYYLESVEKRLLVTYAISASTIGGAVSGLAGMIITGTILALLEKYTNGAVSGRSYAVYFVCAVILLIPGIFVYLSLKPLKMEQRLKKHHFIHLR